MKRVLLSGGGTGGHIYPALAIRELLLEKGGAIETAYAGREDGMEAKIVGRFPELPFHPIRAQGMPRTLSAGWFSFPVVNLLGFIDALRVVRSFRPDLVVTTGGYVAFPVLAAARVLGVPYVIHEQNAAMGVTNRLFAGGAARILLTYAEAWQGKAGWVRVTGNPVRQAFRQQSAGSGRFSKGPGERLVLFVGGSGGARSLNQACVRLGREWLPQRPDIRFLQLTGERDFPSIEAEVGVNPRHQVLPYLHEMKEAFDAADLLVSRAGATILAELAICGKPAILVPFPFATDNHQEKNARALEGAGAAKLLLDRDLSGPELGTLLTESLSPAALERMGQAMRGTRPANVEAEIFQALKPLLS